MRFPSIKDVANDLRAAAQSIDWQETGSEDDAFCDVRLQVTVDGSWCVHVGPSDYDQDHRGFWGASSIPRGRFNARELARDLISQVREHAASFGDYLPE